MVSKIQQGGNVGYDVNMMNQDRFNVEITTGTNNTSKVFRWDTNRSNIEDWLQKECGCSPIPAEMLATAILNVAAKKREELFLKELLLESW